MRSSAASKSPSSNMSRRVPVTVESPEELMQWRDEVQEDPDVDPKLEYFLLRLSAPNVMDRDAWRVVWSVSRMVDLLGKSKATVHKYKDQLLNSKYIRRSGSAPLETGRGDEERDAYALVLPPSV